MMKLGLRKSSRLWLGHLALWAALALPALAQHKHPIQVRRWKGHEVVAQEVIVKLRPSSLLSVQAAQADLESSQDIDASEAIGDGRSLVIHSRSKDVDALLLDIATRNDVEYVQPNYILRATAIPNDAQFANLWGMRNTGQVISGVAGTPGADISATLAWDITTGSRANVVGVVDTGIAYNHPDLAANVWSAPVSFTVNIGGVVRTVPVGAHGFNAITNSFDPLDDNDHGSHVSGTIGGVGNNGIGVAGVNWTASIMGLKFLDAAGSGTTANAINAIEFAIQAKQALGVNANVRVLSNSWGGGGFSQALLDAINKADANNMIFVAAAGNTGTDNDVTPHYPSSYATHNMIAVAATDNRDGLAYFSSFGRTSVHLGAPGVDIYSTLSNGTYAFFSGTSMATPHVSGACALVLAVNGALTIDQVKAAILNNADPISSLTGLTVTGARLNVNRAVRSVGVPIQDFSITASPASQSVARGSGTSYTVTVTPSGGFAGVVTFSGSGLPAGATATFTPTSVTGSGSVTLSVTTSSTTPVGSYPLTITGTSGPLVHATSVTVVVTTPPVQDFSISALPASQTVVRGSGASYTATVTASGGFVGLVGLSVSGLPAGATGTFSPASVTGSGSSILSVTTSSTTLAGTYPLTIKGTSGSLVRTVTVSLVVTAAPGAGDFSISATPSSSSVDPGDQTTYTATITPLGGFTGTVTFSVAGLPAGATASFRPATVTASGSSVLTVRAGDSNAPGTYALAITGTSGSLSRSVSVTLTVR
ncbi:MAG TPA: S8 family serine peptidase [Geothrix sp.]|jgi:subtilisin family serine protease